MNLHVDKFGAVHILHQCNVQDIDNLDDIISKLKQLGNDIGLDLDLYQLADGIQLIIDVID